MEYMTNNASTSKIVPQPPTPVSGLTETNEINSFDTKNDHTIRKSDSNLKSIEMEKILNDNSSVSNISYNDSEQNISNNVNKCNYSLNIGNYEEENIAQMNNLQFSNKISDSSNLNMQNNNSITSFSKLDFVCSLYVTACPTIIRPGDEKRKPVSYIDLENAIQDIQPIGSFKVSETKCGLIATFTHEKDADNLLLNFNLAQALHGPVQVARFSRRDARYKQIATLRDVPWSIPMQDICTALTFQGISYENVDRFRNKIRVEVLDANHYENLISQGLNFFDAARFVAVPDRWYRNLGSNITTNDGHETDSVLQCYRCQGFWHVAANCRHLPRCVRCGEPHGVEFCPRPRNNPICCHCSGAHHAAYKNCPIRVQLMHAIPVSMSLSTTRGIWQSRELRRSSCRS